MLVIWDAIVVIMTSMSWITVARNNDKIARSITVGIKNIFAWTFYYIDRKCITNWLSMLFAHLSVHIKLEVRVLSVSHSMGLVLLITWGFEKSYWSANGILISKDILRHLAWMQNIITRVYDKYPTCNLEHCFNPQISMTRGNNKLWPIYYLPG